MALHSTSSSCLMHVWQLFFSIQVKIFPILVYSCQIFIVLLGYFWPPSFEVTNFIAVFAGQSSDILCYIEIILNIKMAQALSYVAELLYFLNAISASFIYEF